MPEEHAVVIPRSAWERMAQHPQAEAPREAVGLLGGASRGVVEQVCPLPNIAGPLAFFADPYAQFRAEKRFRASTSIVVGYYHSHPGGGLDLSDSDRLFARRQDWLYLLLVTDFHGEQPVSGAAFRFLDGDLKEVPLIVKG